MNDRSPMVIAAAREMCRQSSAACNVDAEDNWKVYGEEFIAEAAKILDAAGVPELVMALQNLLAVHEGEGGTNYHAGDIARAAIRKATGG